MVEKSHGPTNHPLGDLKIFEPKSNDLRLDYPELAEFPEFKELSPSEMKFVWYVANRTSPIISLSKADRWQEAAEKAFGKRAMERQEVKEILAGKMPDKIKAAIEIMVSFNPNYRLRAKFIDEYAFDQIQAMMFVSEDYMVMMDGDMKKKYSDFILKATSELPQLVARLERGYGVSLKNKKKEEMTYKSVASTKDIIKELD